MALRTAAGATPWRRGKGARLLRPRREAGVGSGPPVLALQVPIIGPVGEFDLIEKYFNRPVRRSPQGVGDDCALLAPRPGMQLAVSCDLLVEGRHFLSTVAPERLGHKSLAVNLSDLAACGAEPLAFTLALAMPRADEAFLAPFAQGLFALADAHGIELVGGDTTAGPLTVCITVFGEVPAGGALLRGGARAGDALWVSGTLGDARLALEAFRGTLALDGGDFEAVRVAMEQPQPRVALGQALRGLASSAIDLSDGLLGDLGHILARSGAGARVQCDALPRSAVLARQPAAVQRLCALQGGDDYELLFSAAPERAAEVQAAARAAGVPVTRIGTIEAAPGLRVFDGDALLAVPARGFDHFAT
jgi:thiamine-monophosphate kinase